MSEYVIRCSKDDAPPIVFIRSMATDEAAEREARLILKLCDYPRAEIWNDRRMVQTVGH